MQRTKNKDHVLFKNDLGEYHLSNEEYARLGHDAAEAIALSEIEKKAKTGQFTDAVIDFDKARSLGFCEYGIKDFCSKLNLDIAKQYSIKELLNKLTVDAVTSYPNETLKLFGKDVFLPFNGPVSFLGQNKTSSALNIVFKSNILNDKDIRLLACDFAESALSNFESKYPNDEQIGRASCRERV